MGLVAFCAFYLYIKYMGSVRKHRKVYSDGESMQFAAKPGSDTSSSMSFGDKPFGRFGSTCIEELLHKLDYFEPDDFFIQSDVYDFSGVHKI